MAGFLVTRILLLAASLLVASLVIFLVLDVLPGDPARVMLGIGATPESLAALRAQLGLDAPALWRYLGWLAGLVTGDLGTSYTYRVPVAELIGQRILVSLPLAVYALALSTMIALPLGILAAARRKTLTDGTLMAASQIGIAVPNFWFGILLVALFATTLRWFPAGGFPGWSDPVAAMRALTLPAIALALPQAAILARVMRSAMLDTLSEDYVRTARAKGLTRFGALLRHALRNALIPVLTIMGLQFSFLLAGAIIIENIFYLPGLGRLLFQAITQRDLITVKSVVLLLVVAVIAVNFLVELCYLAVDPRLRRARS